MTTTAQATAAPIMRSFKGKEYWLSPLTDQDYGSFERFVQDQVMEVARRNLEGLPTDKQEVLLKHAFDRASAITLSSVEALKYMESVPGAIRILFLSLRHRHADITEAEVGELITDPAVFSSAMDTLQSLSPREKKPKTPAPRKKIRKRRLKPKK